MARAALGFGFAVLLLSSIARPDPRPATLKDGEQCGGAIRGDCAQGSVCRPSSYGYPVCVSEKKLKEDELRALTNEADSIMRSMKDWSEVWIANNYDATGVRGSLTSSQTIAKAIADLRTIVSKLRGLEPTKGDVVDKIAAQVDGLEKDAQEALAKESKCRSTPACLGPRIAVNFCRDTRERAETVRAIATERANPGGVVDLVRLHTLGEKVQAYDAAIADEKAAYLKNVKRPLTEASCTPKPALHASDPTR